LLLTVVVTRVLQLLAADVAANQHHHQPADVLPLAAAPCRNLILIAVPLQLESSIGSPAAGVPTEKNVKILQILQQPQNR
jgi:hypothetical protein